MGDVMDIASLSSGSMMAKVAVYLPEAAAPVPRASLWDKGIRDDDYLRLDWMATERSR